MENNTIEFVCADCPRMCYAIRGKEGRGFCRMGLNPVLARAALHFDEEPCISGDRGSGAVFFSGCALRCRYCQNFALSHERFGKEITVDRLREIYQELIAQGAHNINLVNPTHFAEAVGQSLETAPGVPVVWNSGGYDRVETLRGLKGLVDIYLPDLKYLEEEPAGRYSAAPDYPQVAVDAIREMVRQTGPCSFDENGLLKKGVVIRHLILPGQLPAAKRVMDWVKEEFEPGTVLFSLMSQYTPWGRAAEFPEINRKLRKGEIRSAMEYMEILGLDGFTQEAESAQRDYTPAFDLTGI